MAWRSPGLLNPHPAVAMRTAAVARPGMTCVGASGEALKWLPRAHHTRRPVGAQGLLEAGWEAGCEGLESEPPPPSIDTRCGPVARCMGMIGMIDLVHPAGRRQLCLDCCPAVPYGTSVVRCISDWACEPQRWPTRVVGGPAYRAPRVTTDSRRASGVCCCCAMALGAAAGAHTLPPPCGRRKR